MHPYSIFVPRGASVKQHLAVVCIVLFSLSLFAQQPSKAAQETPEAIFAMCQDSLLNREYVAAAECFGRYIDIRPDESKGYRGKVYSLYFGWKAEQHQETPKVAEPARKELLKLVADGIARADKHITEGKDVDFELFIKAGLLSMRGGIEYGNYGRVQGKLTGLSTIREVLAAASKSKYQDAKAIVGLIGYRGSDHSFWFSVADLPHDREEGLAKVYEAVLNNRGCFVDEIWFSIFEIYKEPKNKGRYSEEDRTRVFQYLYRKYPRNPLLQEYAATHNL